MPRSDIGHQVGRRLRDLRLQAGLTQPELGERARMAAAEISKIENGRRTPTLETLERLCRALGVSVEEVVAAPVPADEQELVINQILMRLRGQPAETLVRVAAVIDAIIRTS